MGVKKLSVDRLQVFPANRQNMRIFAEKYDSAASLDQILENVSDRWNKLEDKTSVILYGSLALVAVYFVSAIVGAINNIPLLPELMESVGLAYTGWFVVRYLFFRSSREELVQDIEELRKKVSGGL